MFDLNLNNYQNRRERKNLIERKINKPCNVKSASGACCINNNSTSDDVIVPNVISMFENNHFQQQNKNKTKS